MNLLTIKVALAWFGSGEAYYCCVVLSTLPPSCKYLVVYLAIAMNPIHSGAQSSINRFAQTRLTPWNSAG
ncbi:hypothetical protein BC835DRAFT_1098796 [Cytidiella melzeri]|nr:hypothetical protein BC835DRAFT_1098796 [Cytidiella melzeri]